MKRYFYILVAALLAVSCGFLDEDAKGKMASEDFFSNSQDLDASLNSLYYIISVSQQSNNHIGTNFLSGDDITTHTGANKDSLREFDKFDVSDNNAWMQTLWEQRFKVIKAANFIINNASRTPGVPQEKIYAAIAQAHYWRAFEYFYLVTTWGAVPVMLEESIDYNAPLMPIEDLYDFIISDLKIAENGCPDNYSDAPYFQNGRNIAVSKGAVKATMAYVYMCMAGWPLNKGTEYYILAANKAREVIDGAENGTYYYKLLENFSDVHSIKRNRDNEEVLLGIYYNRDRNPNAIPAADCLFETRGGWGDVHGEIKFWKNFPDGPRKEATYFPKIVMKKDDKWSEVDWWYDPMGIDSETGKEKHLRDVVAPVFMKTAEGPARGEEFDYRDTLGCISSGEKTVQVIRLAQVYCWYAEAVGRAGAGDKGKAAEVLGKVAARAYNADNMPNFAAMSYEELAEAAYNEHGWEVAGYYWSGFATRSRDMFRMYRFKEHFEHRVKNPMIHIAEGVERNEWITVKGTWDDSKMYAPYPYTDSAVNPSM